MNRNLAWAISVVWVFAFAFAPVQADWPTESYKGMVQSIRKADKVILHEGLPHQQLEAGQLAVELKNKKTTKLHGLPFYEEVLSLKERDAKKLATLVCDEKSFKPTYRNELLGIIKLCGQFHPDYCIEWRTGKQVYQVLICFGCQEVKCFGPQVELYLDIKSETYAEFEKILKAYRK